MKTIRTTLLTLIMISLNISMGHAYSEGAQGKPWRNRKYEAYLLKFYDSDKDGILSEDEMSRCIKDLLRKFDHNKNRLIEGKELEAMEKDISRHSGN